MTPAIWNAGIFPFLLGLLGFIEPCSLGANVIFLKYSLPLGRGARIAQSVLFALTRALFLSGIGVASALIGRKLIGVQGTYIHLLGAIYLLFGLVVLISRPAWIFSLPFPRLQERSLPLLLGAAFGIAVPACASPIVLALAGGAALSGDLWFGFVSLLIFGIGLSLPLVAVLWSETGREALIRFGRRYPGPVRYAIGSLLIFAGLYTLAAGSGSLRAIFR